MTADMAATKKTGRTACTFACQGKVPMPLAEILQDQHKCFLLADCHHVRHCGSDTSKYMELCFGLSRTRCPDRCARTDAIPHRALHACDFIQKFRCKKNDWCHQSARGSSGRLATMALICGR